MFNGILIFSYSPSKCFTRSRSLTNPLRRYSRSTARSRARCAFWKHSENATIDDGQFLLETVSLLEEINIFPKLSKSDTIFSIGLPQFTELHHALDDLAQVIHEAREENFPLPSSPLPTNPYHADIVLPSLAAEDREEQKRHAQELADASRWRSRANTNE